MQRLLFLGRNSLHDKGKKSQKQGFLPKNYDQNHVILNGNMNFNIKPHHHD